jgi:hypothetical protein
MSEPNKRCYPNTFNPERDQRLIVGWLAGAKTQDIADSIGMSYKATSTRRRRLGLPPRINFIKWTPERDATLRELLAKGFSAAAVAKTLGEGITRCSVLGRAFRLGLSCPRPPSVPKIKVPKPKRVSVGPSRRSAPGRSAYSSSAETLALPEPDYATCVPFEKMNGNCHWPIGEPTLFCPRKACEISHGSYCEQHYARSVSSSAIKKAIHPHRRVA